VAWKVVTLKVKQKDFLRYTVGSSMKLFSVTVPESMMRNFMIRKRILINVSANNWAMITVWERRKDAHILYPVRI